MNLKRYVFLAVATLCLAGSFFLPNIVAGVMDARRLDNVIAVDAESISISTDDPALDLPERIKLVSSPNTEMLALTTGLAMGTETAKTRAMRELGRFFRGSYFEFEVNGCTVEDYSILFVIDAEDPTANIIIWELKIIDQHHNEALVSIDDETGMILKLIYQLGDGRFRPAGSSGGEADSSLEDDIHAAALELAEAMTAYYRMQVSLGDYEFSGNMAYYRGEMQGAGEAVPMYGVVRANSFTMNERV